MVSGDGDVLGFVGSDGFILAPEMRPAIATVREPVVDEYGYVTHHVVREVMCAVHTVQVGKGGWVCETEGGAVMIVPYEKVRFIDAEEGR